MLVCTDTGVILADGAWDYTPIVYIRPPHRLYVYLRG